MIPSRPTGEPRRKRLRRADVPGEARFLTFSCFRRQPFLSRDRACDWFIQALDRARTTHGFDLWAYVIMPEHAHVLVYPGDAPHRMADFLYTLKKSVSRRALEFVRKAAPQFLARMRDRQPNGTVSYRFWQRGGGYDENLFTSTKVWQKIDYIHENPVRRGLCAHPSDWKWSSFRAHETGGQDPIRIDFDSLPDSGRRR
ncbi:MAG: transposase [Phycisphaerae bacterium]|jgi:putative transposase